MRFYDFKHPNWNAIPDNTSKHVEKQMSQRDLQRVGKAVVHVGKSSQEASGCCANASADYHHVGPLQADNTNATQWGNNCTHDRTGLNSDRYRQSEEDVSVWSQRGKWRREVFVNIVLDQCTYVPLEDRL